MKTVFSRGFTFIELIVVVAIISIMAAALYSNFNESRMIARDEARKASLTQLRISLELYKAQYGRYPEEGCGGATSWTGPGPHSAAWGNNTHCQDYIIGLAPEFLSELPTDPKFEMDDNEGYLYQTNATGSAYKVLVTTAEIDLISDWSDDYARCPYDTGSSWCGSGNLQTDTYAIYSVGAETW